MSSGHCIKAIKGRVEKLPGVNAVKANLD
ncbi:MULTISPECIES: cation transporter [Peribacillus]